MKSVLLAGGLGTRMREETEFRPKPMVEIGGRPVLWHIMKVLGEHGLNEFVICAGYRAEVIKSYFLNYMAMNSDFTLRLGDTAHPTVHGDHPEADWTVTVADTGQKTMTGGRIRRVREYVDGSRFLCTYGDGVADVDVTGLLEFHKRQGKIATVTTVRPTSRFGVLEVGDDGVVKQFAEKPQTDGWVNMGYFIFEPEIFDYLDDDATVLEQEPLRRLAADGQLAAFKHEGFWQPMDTYRESLLLNSLWEEGNAPWRTWQ